VRLRWLPKSLRGYGSGDASAAGGDEGGVGLESEVEGVMREMSRLVDGTEPDV